MSLTKPIFQQYQTVASNHNYPAFMPVLGTIICII